MGRVLSERCQGCGERRLGCGEAALPALSLAATAAAVALAATSAVSAAASVAEEQGPFGGGAKGRRGGGASGTFGPSCPEAAVLDAPFASNWTAGPAHRALCRGASAELHPAAAGPRLLRLCRGAPACAADHRKGAFAASRPHEHGLGVAPAGGCGCLRSARRGRRISFFNCQNRLSEQANLDLGCPRFASRTPSVFLSFFLYILQHPLFSSLFSRENSVEIVKFGALSCSEPRLRLVWAQNQPNFRPNRQNSAFREYCGAPCDPPGYFVDFLNFASLRFCPRARPALRLRETREFPEWSTKHPLFSLEISGNKKCWGPSVFLFVCRKTSDSPNLDSKLKDEVCVRTGAKCVSEQGLRFNVRVESPWRLGGRAVWVD